MLHVFFVIAVCFYLLQGIAQYALLCRPFCVVSQMYNVSTTNTVFQQRGGFLLVFLIVCHTVILLK